MPSALIERPAAAAPLPVASQPRPRPNRSPRRAARIRVQNRRLEYLRRNPSYVESSDREFADVQLYHELVRAFQTPEERSAEARDKGFGQVLEASILRNPERLHRLGEEEVEEEDEDEDEDEGEGEGKEGKETTEAGDSPAANGGNDDDADVGDLEHGSGPKDAASRRWLAIVRDWFVGGGALADGFDYVAVDDDSDYDVLARADEEEAWFDNEPPGWADDGSDDGMRLGETGVQDY